MLETIENARIRFIVAGQCLVILLLYRLPTSGPKPKGNGFTVKQFFNEFSGYFQDFMVDPNAHMIVIGDINFHLDNPNNQDAASFNELMVSCSAVQLVPDFTHRSRHILDVFVVQDSECDSAKVTVGDFVSDHCLVLGELDPQSQRNRSSSADILNTERRWAENQGETSGLVGYRFRNEIPVPADYLATENALPT